MRRTVGAALQGLQAGHVVARPGHHVAGGVAVVTRHQTRVGHLPASSQFEAAEVHPQLSVSRLRAGRHRAALPAGYRREGRGEIRIRYTEGCSQMMRHLNCLHSLPAFINFK